MSQHNDQLPDDWTRRARPKLHSVIYGSLKGCLDDATVNLVVSYCIPKRTYISCGIYYLPSVLDVYEDWKVDPYLQLPIGNLQHMNRNRFHTHFGVLVPNLDDISITDLYIKITHKQSKASGRYYTQCHGLYLVMNKHLDEKDSMERFYLASIDGEGTRIVRTSGLPYTPLPGESLELWLEAGVCFGRSAKEYVEVTAEVVLVHGDLNRVNAVMACSNRVDAVTAGEMKGEMKRDDVDEDGYITQQGCMGEVMLVPSSSQSTYPSGFFSGRHIDISQLVDATPVIPYARCTCYVPLDAVHYGTIHWGSAGTMRYKKSCRKHGAFRHNTEPDWKWIEGIVKAPLSRKNKRKIGSDKRSHIVRSFEHAVERFLVDATATESYDDSVPTSETDVDHHADTTVATADTTAAAATTTSTNTAASFDTDDDSIADAATAARVTRLAPQN